MKFSIIVPIFNVEKYLSVCLQSIRYQSYENFECIMVDDGSTDMCGKICDQFSKLDSRFIVLHKKNEGLVSARKEGAKRAVGDYIINVDGDDFVATDLLDRMNTIIKQYYPEVICFGATKYRNHKIGEMLPDVEIGMYEGKKLENLKKTYLYNSKKRGINSGGILFNICAKCIRRDIYKKCQNKVPNTIISGEDTVFTFFLCQNVQSIYNIDYLGYYYRMAPQSIEHTFNKQCFSNLLEVTTTMMNAEINKKYNFTNNILVYFLYRNWHYCLLAAQNCKNFQEYKVLIKENICEETIVYFKNAKIRKGTLYDWIKVFLLKYKHWGCIFILANTWFRKKID